MDTKFPEGGFWGGKVGSKRGAREVGGGEDRQGGTGDRCTLSGGKKRGTAA